MKFLAAGSEPCGPFEKQLARLQRFGNAGGPPSKLPDIIEGRRKIHAQSVVFDRPGRDDEVFANHLRA